MSDTCCGSALDAQFVADKHRRRILSIVLAINTMMFGFELTAGLWASSTALQADSLDMFADSLVYAISLYAVSHGPRARAFAGLSNGVLELLLGLTVLAQVGYHIVAPVTPLGSIIMIVAAIALTANLLCAALLLRFRHEDINMRAVWLCTRNDALGNAGTILAGGLVVLLTSRWPDLIIGTILAFILIYTAVKVIRITTRETRTPARVESLLSTEEKAL